MKCARAIKQLDLLLFTHNHWDHYKEDYALEIFKQTRPYTVADIITSEELKAHIPPNMLATADYASNSRPRVKVCNVSNR